MIFKKLEFSKLLLIIKELNKNKLFVYLFYLSNFNADKYLNIFSISWNTKEAYYAIEWFKFILFVNISIILWVPETWSTHVKSTFPLLKYQYCAWILKLFTLVLCSLDNFLWYFISPSLSISSIIFWFRQFLIDNIRYYTFNSWLKFLKWLWILKWCFMWFWLHYLSILLY